MTRKHFQMFADTVSTMMDARDADTLARVCLTVFRAENPRFDDDRFLSACGFDAERTERIKGEADTSA